MEVLADFGALRGGSSAAGCFTGVAVHRRGFFEPAEHAAIKANLPSPYNDIAEFGYLTGWRLGEILGLRWEDVDDDAVRLRDTKNGEARSFPLRRAGPRAVREVVVRRKAAREYTTPEGPAESEYVFHVAGCRVWKFDAVWRAARTVAKLPHRLFHDYRRTAVRDLIRSGVSQHVAMRWTGHKTEAVFRRYDIVATSDLEAAAERLDLYRQAQAERAAPPMDTTEADAHATIH